MTIKPLFTAEQIAAINAAGRDFDAKMRALGDAVRAAGHDGRRRPTREITPLLRPQSMASKSPWRSWLISTPSPPRRADMADESRLAELLVRHFPRDMMDADGVEWQECGCTFRFEEPEEWAQHAAAQIATAPTDTEGGTPDAAR